MNRGHKQGSTVNELISSVVLNRFGAGLFTEKKRKTGWGLGFVF